MTNLSMSAGCVVHEASEDSGGSDSDRSVAKIIAEDLYLGKLKHAYRCIMWSPVKRTVHTYSYTISPHAKWMGKDEVQQLNGMLFKSKSTIGTMYIMELSNKGKWHSHGVVFTTRKQKFSQCKSRLAKMYFDTEPDDGWLKYMIKDNPSMLYVTYKPYLHADVLDLTKFKQSELFEKKNIML